VEDEDLRVNRLIQFHLEKGPLDRCIGSTKAIFDALQEWKSEGLRLSTTSNEAAKLYDVAVSQVFLPLIFNIDYSNQMIGYEIAV